MLGPVTTPYVVGLGHRLSARLLQGEGLASLHAYRLPGRPTLPTIAHGRAGDHVALVLAAQAAPTELDLPTVAATEVRVHIGRQAETAAARVAIADVHALGRARRLGPRRAAALASRIGGAVAVAVAADRRNVVVSVHLAELVLHSPLGVQRLPVPQLPDAPRSWSALEAHEQCLHLGEWALAALIDAVEDGSVPGGSRPAPASPTRPHPLAGRILPVDADPFGVLLFDLRGESAQVVTIPFETPAANPDEIPARLASLLDEALSVAPPPRI